MIAGLPVAGFWGRVGASLVDAVFLWVTATVALVVVLGLAQSSIALLLVYALPVAYYVWGWSNWSGGQTLGKRALGQRVVDVNGRPITKLRAFGRLLGAFISGLPLGLGYLWAAWDPHKQTWHDKMVGTYVVFVAQAGFQQSVAPVHQDTLLRMPCPRCGESIPLTARVCRFCGVEFESPVVMPRQ